MVFRKKARYALEISARKQRLGTTSDVLPLAVETASLDIYNMSSESVATHAKTVSKLY